MPPAGTSPARGGRLGELGCEEGERGEGGTGGHRRKGRRGKEKIKKREITGERRNGGGHRWCIGGVWKGKRGESE